MANPEDVKLMQGASYRNIGMVTEALDHGANVNAVTTTSNSGNTTLHIITEMGLPADNAKLLPIVTLLISRRANLNIQNRDGTTPLMYATTSKNTETMKLLLDAGADANLRHNSGQTALNMARDLQFADGVTLLEGRMQVSEPVVPVPADPPNPNKELLLAALRGQLDKVKELLAAGANVNHFEDETYMTPIMYATSRDHLDIVNELIANAADLTMTDRNGATALHIAASYGHVDILRRIIDEDREGLNTPNTHGQTALHQAAEGGMVNSVRLLLQRGADPTIQDADGNTAADLAQTPEIRALFPAPSHLFMSLSHELPPFVPDPDPIVFEVTKIQYKNQKVYDFEENEEVPILSLLSKTNSIIFKAKESYFTLPLTTILKAIKDGSQVRHKCKAQLEGVPYEKDVDMDHMYYYIQGNGNFLVWLDQIHRGLLTQDFKIFDLTETDEELDNVASAQNVQTTPGMNRYGNAVNIVGGDHCQAGTKQKVFKLNPVILTDEAQAPAPSSSGEKRRRVAEDDASQAADILRRMRTSGGNHRTWKRKAGRKGRKTMKSRK
jgi:ankyrin repeat protein